MSDQIWVLITLPEGCKKIELSPGICKIAKIQLVGGPTMVVTDPADIPIDMLSTVKMIELGDFAKIGDAVLVRCKYDAEDNTFYFAKREVPYVLPY